MAVGILLGWVLRNKKIPFLSNIIMILIWVLLFLLGVEVGGDENLIRSMGSLGFEGFIISLAGVAGSCFLALCLWRWSKNKDSE